MSNLNETTSVYLHIGNGGITFSVRDEGYGPTFVMTTSSFGNMETETKVFTTLAGLEAIRDMLTEALDPVLVYSEPYMYAARADTEEQQRCIDIRIYDDPGHSASITESKEIAGKALKGRKLNYWENPDGDDRRPA